MIYKFKLNKKLKKTVTITGVAIVAVCALIFAVAMTVAAGINFGISLPLGILFGVFISAVMILSIYGVIAFITKKVEAASTNVRNSVENKRHIAFQGFASCGKVAGWLIVTQHTIEFYAVFDENGNCSFRKLILKSSVREVGKSAKGEILLRLDEGSVVGFTTVNDEFGDRIVAEAKEKGGDERATDAGAADEFAEKK